MIYLPLSLGHRQVATHRPEFSEDSLGAVLTEILKIFRICHSSLWTLKFSLLSHLRESNLLIQEQEQQLAYLRHKLQEGREVWALLSQHLNDLLTHDGSDDHQGQAFRQQLAEGYRLAKHLAHILGPGKVATGPHCTELLQGAWLTRPSTPPLVMF